MKKSEIMDTFAFLLGCYPAEFARIGTDSLERMANSWGAVFCNERFANLNGQGFMESAKRHVMGKRGRSFPTPRDLIEQMPDYSQSEDGPDAASS